MLERLGTIHRDAWRDAARLGLQSGVAAALAWLAAEAIGGLEHFLVIMMAVTSLQRSVGGTIGQAGVRFQSAIAGSLMGFVAILLVPEGWSTALVLLVALTAVGAAMTLRSSWQLAVVPAVGMSLAGRDDVLGTALTTSFGIVLGAAIGLVVSLVLWPERSEARFERHYRRALKATAIRLSDAIEATMEEGHAPRVPEHVGAWNESVWLAQEALSAARFVKGDSMQRRLDALRELHESVSILDRAAEVSDPPLSVEAMRSRVWTLRREACDVLLRMAEGERTSGRRIGAIDDTLVQLRKALDEEDPGSAEHEAHSTVAFGLREVRRTLAALIEAQRGAPGPRGGVAGA